MLDPLAGLPDLVAEQDGVVSRRQLLDHGLTVTDIARLLRRRTLVRLHRGVYVAHTGPPTWHQQAWAAVLAGWPAALSHGSALRAAEGPGSRRDAVALEIVVDRHRSTVKVPGVRVHRSAHLDRRVQWHLGPPRVRYEDAALDVAGAAPSALEALAEVSRAVQGRRTTAARLRDAVDDRARLPRGRWLRDVLEDVAGGACSVLEHRYLLAVERAHGLARARRQVRDRVGSGAVYRDVEYDGGLVVELDGRLHHDTTRQRDRDFDRDLVAAVAGKQSVRLSYGQVFDRPCWTASQVALLLRQHGWTGRPHGCGPRCALVWSAA